MAQRASSAELCSCTLQHAVDTTETHIQMVHIAEEVQPCDYRTVHHAVICHGASLSDNGGGRPGHVVGHKGEKL